jgi:hypothetical protein
VTPVIGFVHRKGEDVRKRFALVVVAATGAVMLLAGAASAAPASALGPTIGVSFAGVSQTGITPPDATGAVGPSSYIEIINLTIAIYQRTGSLITSAGLSTLTGHSSLSDPMVLWDPDTQRFYYNVWDTGNARMDIGFSKSSNPTSVPSSFCNYEFDFGYPTNVFPDYPKLGQTKDFLMVGINYYPSLSNLHATSQDLLWTSKPQGSGTITTCPAQSTFKSGKFVGLKNQDGSQAFTPVPAIQTDPSSNGLIVASSDIECPDICGTGTLITIFQLKPNPQDPTVPRMSTKGKSVTVASFAPPSTAGAPQKGNTKLLNVLDGRLTHAVSGIDPRFGKLTVWTSHAVLGGAGSEVRWYEIQPGNTPLLKQSGAITDPSLWVYNGGVSPDRTCTLTTCAHGDTMIAGVTTSSANAFTTIQMVEKIGAGAQSAMVVVHAATVAENDFSCAPTCRWGDYSGATPDPAASISGAHGEVWLTNEFAGGSKVNTWNWEAIP